MLARSRVSAAGGRERERERGSGTIAVVGLIAVVIGVTAMLAPVVGISAARHRGAAAADSAALAAAAVVAGVPIRGAADDPAGSGTGPCELAGRLAERHDATIDACRIEGLAVTVTVAVDTAFGVLRVTATAGPADERRPWLDE